ncbi:MAG: hypothetical protein KDD61_12925 [Bdellovibrionales bacterium]|nr:hypothetical protein [Bdellovibrionales bacterium]
MSGSITPVTSYVNPTNESNLNFSGTCSEFNQSVSITIDDSNGATSAITVGTVCTAGNVFSLSIDVSSLDDDTLSVNLSHQDLAGNQQTTTLSSLTKDTLVPTMAITSPTGTDYINVSNVVLFPVSGSCSEAGQDVLLTVDDSNGATTAATGTVTCSGGNTFSGNLNLSGLDNGAIDITASHVDAAGNSVNAVPVSLVKDTVVPSLSIAVPTGGAFIFSGNVTAFTMSGSCSEAGRDVSYFVNDENGGTAEISGTVSCTGANDFSTSLDLSSLEDGNITFTASHTDVAGNEVEASSVLATKDTAAPVVAVVSPLATDYINLLNQSSFLVSGTCSDVGQTVKVSMDDANGATVAVENTVACSGANNFSMNLNLSTLDDGVINIAVSHDDSAGNSVIGTPVSLIKDTVAPSVAITSPIATDMINGGNLTNFAFSGTCSEVGESIELVVDDSNGGTPSVTATIPCSGSNNFTTNLDLSGLDDGPIHFDASHTDTAGNSVTATRVTITKDTGLPSVAITAPIVSDFVNSVSEGSFTISGTCSDVSEDVHLSVDDTNGATTAVTTTISCSGSNNFSTALNLSTLDDGTITISVSHEDASSNVTNGSPVSLTKDTALPVVALTAPTVSDYINSGNVGSFTISGTCSEVGQVINLSSDDTNGGTSSVDTSTACSGANNFSTTVNLSGLDDDSITISVSHVDVAGNSATGAPVTLTKDTGLPTASITSPTETDFANFTTKNAFPINGSCSETGKSVSISIDDTNGGTAPVTVSVACDGANDYSTTANLSSLDDGTLTVSVTHVDDAENSSVAVTVDFTKDTGLPTVSITSPLAASYINATSQSSYAVSGSCSEVGRDVVVSVDDVNGGTAAVTSDVACQAGNIFSTVLDVSSLDDGAVNLTASHSDAAGNTGNATLVAVTKDTVAPSVSILFPDITDTISTGNEGSFTISGSCSEEGRAVTLVVADGSVITPDVSPGTQPNCSSGTFTTSVDLSSLDDGNITITADHNDAALNEAVQSSVTVLKDSALPSVTIAFPTVSDYINTGNVGTFSVNGTCTEASQDVDISIDDTNGGTTAVTATVSCTGGNNYTASLDLSSLDDDSLTVTVTHDDSVGNTSSPETVVLTKDTVRPTATINQSISETVGSCVFSNQADPAFAFPLEFRVTFSEAVNPSSFSYGSFINSGTGGGVSFSGSLTSCGDNQNYSLKVVSMSPMGSMDFSLSAGEISDVAGNTNGVASGGTDTSILYYDSPFYWVGSVDSNWWTAGNWSGGSVPTSTDVAKFSDVCGGNCNANINGNVNVGGVDLQSSYSGTLTQEAARTIILQESGLTQSGGSFVGGNADITFINSDFTVSSGSFTATSAKIFISRNLNIGAGATFNHNSGTIEVNANSYIPYFTPNNHVFHNLVLNQTGGSDREFNLNGQTMYLENNLFILSSCGTCEIENGVIDVKGDVHVTTSSALLSGTGSIKLTGSGTQYISGSGYIPPLWIASTGTVEFANDLNILTQIRKTSGNVSVNGHKVTLLGNSNYTTSREIDPGDISFQDLTIKYVVAGDRAIDVLGSVIVNGNLEIDNDCPGTCDFAGTGSFLVKGNVILDNQSSNHGSVDLVLNGSTDQNITYLGGGVPGGTWSINKVSGDVVLQSNLSLNGSGQDLKILDGDLDLNSFNLTVNDRLEVGDGIGAASSARVLQGCSTIASGTTVIAADGDVIDSLSNPSVSISDASVNEGGDLVFNVSLSEGVCGGSFTVNYSVTGVSALSGMSDYNPTADDSDGVSDGVLTIAAGETLGTITIHTTGDTNLESDEELLVTLSTPSHGSFSDDTGVGTIVNDDDNGYIWTGDAGDSDFYNGANWSNGVSAPTPGSSVLFDDTCSDVPANCDVTLNGSFNFGTLSIGSSYPGTIAVSGGAVVSIGGEGFLQNGGTFHAGSGNFSSDRIWITAGVYTATSATTTTTLNSYINPSVTFNHNNGAWTAESSSTGSGTYLSASGHSFYNMSVVGQTSEKFYLVGSVIVVNDLTINMGGDFGYISSGEFQVYGNANLVASGVTYLSDAVVTLKGGSSVYTGAAGEGGPHIRIDSPGTVTLQGAEVTTENLTLVSGSIDIQANKVTMIAFGGVLNVPSMTEFNDLSFSHSSSGSVTISNNIVVNGQLTYGVAGCCGFVNGATIHARGNISGAALASRGTSSLTIDGTSNQSLSGNEFPAGTVTVDKASGTLNLLNSVNFGGSSQDLVLADGDINLNGYTLTIADNLSTASGTTIHENCGSVVYNTYSPADGSIVSTTQNPDISVSDASVLEGGNLAFTISYSEAICSPSSVDFATSDISTLAGIDYTTYSATVPVSSGLTSVTVSVSTSVDSDIEPDEVLLATISNASVGTIVDVHGYGVVLNDDGDIYSGDLTFGGTHGGTEWDGEAISIAATYPGNGLEDGSWIDTTGLVLYYRLNEASPSHNDTISADVGYVNGTLVTNDGTTNKSVDGKLGRALSFDGIDDYVSVPDNPNFDPGGQASWCLWLRPEVNLSGSAIFMQDQSSERTNATYKWIGAYITGGSQSLATYVRMNGSVYNASFDSGTGGFYTKRWTHVCSTFDRTLGSNRLKLYINGELKALNDAEDADIESGDFPRIGVWDKAGSGANKYFQGSLDEISMWHRTLSENEVRKMFRMQASQFGAIYTSEVINAGGDDDWKYLSWSPKAPYMKSLPGNGASEGSYDSYSVTMNTNTVTNELYLKLDESGVATTYTDTSGLNNDMTCSNCPVEVDGIVGSARHFDGNNDAIQIAAPSGLNNSRFTVSLWIRPSRDWDNSMIEELISHPVASGDNKATFLFAWDHTNVGSEQAWKFHDGSLWRTIKYNTLMKAHVWHHIVVTYDGTDYKIYLNGVFDNSRTGTPLFGNDRLYVGSGAGAAVPWNFYKGDIDEVAIWEEPLSDAEIYKLFHRGAQRVRIQVRGCADATCSTSPTFVGPGSDGSKYFSELLNPNLNLPSLDISGTAISTQYFQYRIYLESDISGSSPKVKAVRVTGEPK